MYPLIIQVAPLIAQTAPAEPSPGGWTATGEKIVGLAHSQPDAFWPVVAVALPLVLLVGIGILLVRWVIPAWREEKKADRDSLVAALRQRGEEAERDATKDRELAKSQSEALVGRIETKIDGIRTEVAKIDGRVERHSEVLARLALKVGAGLALLCAFLGGLAAGAGAFALADRSAVPVSGPVPGVSSSCSQLAGDTAKGECVRKPCNPRTQYCCGPERCCEIKEGTATETTSDRIPVSSLQYISATNYALFTCFPGVDVCF